MSRTEVAMTGKKLLIVVGGVPHPTEGASVVLYHNYIDGCRQAGFDVLNLVLLSNDQSEDGLEEYRRRMEGDHFRVVVARSDRFVRTSRWRHAFDHAALAAIRPEVEAFKPDAALLLDFASAWAVDGWSVGRRTVWLGDLNFETFLHHALYARREGEGRIDYLVMAMWHAFLWKGLYRKILAPCERIVVSSKSSEAKLAALGLQSHYLAYPWPAELKSDRAVTRATKPTFFFFGQLGGLGSRSAFHLMAEGIYPLLRDAFGAEGFEILIGGRGGVPPWAQRAMTGRPEFRHLGFVEDLDAVMGSCHAVLAPIDVPVGNRSRILTALAKGILVIAHRNTALGNPDLVDGETCYLADTPLEFLDRLRRSVECPEDAATVANAGFQVYKRLFSPQAAVPAMLDVVRDSLTERKV